MFPFVFNPYFGRNNTVRILDQVIPKINTISVSDSTESTVLGICPKVWCRLPREGVFVLEVRHTPATASATLPVFVSTTGSVSTASNNNNIPVVKGDSTPLVGSEISANDCKVKKESVLKYDEEMRRCEDILKLLNTTPDITTNVTKDFKELDELKAEVKELKQLLQNVTTVRPEVKIETPSSEEKQIEI